MIEELHNEVDKDRYGNIYGLRNIGEREIVAKINEIIRYINGQGGVQGKDLLAKMADKQ